VAEEEDRAAFYALQPGGWRDYLTLLHPPYTLWHLSYVAIGAALAASLRLEWLGETLLAFFLAMGIGAHALDELHGRPLGTRISDRTLIVLAVIGIGGAVAIGIHGVFVSTAWIGVAIGVGGFIVVAYNLELFKGAFHSDLWFAIAWGAFPVIVAYLAQTGKLSVAAVLAAIAATAMSASQRVLSTPVRRLRRKVAGVEGQITFRDGSVEPIDAAALRAAPERALRLMCIAMPLLAAAMVLANLLR
jgi:hypothetical protein